MNDSMGLCTIKLLELMQTAQGQVLDSLTRSRSNKNLHVAPEDTTPNMFTEEIPAISYLTNPRVIRQQLIVYNRQVDLLPLLNFYAEQALEYCSGDRLDYDFKKIEEALARSLLDGKIPVKFQVRHFQFRGDVKASGHLSDLHMSIPQRPLPPSVLENIWQEVDTRDRLLNLLRQVEMCISFLGSIASSTHASLDGEMFMHQYMVDTLLVDRALWDNTTTQTINQSVRLCHLQSLYMELEEKMFGSPLEKVEEQYRQPLPDVLKKEIRDVHKLLDRSCLIPLLRQFLIEQLSEAKWDPVSSLKEYLSYMGSSVDLDEEEWYVAHFPAPIQLQHTYDLYYRQSSKKSS